MGEGGRRPSGLVSGGGCRCSVPLGAPVGAAMPAGGFARPAPAFHHPPLPPSFHSGFPNGILGAAGWRLGRNINGSRGAGAAQARPAERGGKRGRKREKAPSPQPWSAAAAPRPLPCTPPQTLRASAPRPRWVSAPIAVALRGAGGLFLHAGPIAHPIGASYGVGGGCKSLFLFFFLFGLHLAQTDGMAVGRGRIRGGERPKLRPKRKKTRKEGGGKKN